MLLPLMEFSWFLVKRTAILILLGPEIEVDVLRSKSLEGSGVVRFNCKRTTGQRLFVALSV